MASAIAGLTTAVLEGTAMQVVSASAVTFISALGMAMTAYQFVSHPPPSEPPSDSSAHTPPDGPASKRWPRRIRRNDRVY